MNKTVALPPHVIRRLEDSIEDGIDAVLAGADAYQLMTRKGAQVGTLYQSEGSGPLLLFPPAQPNHYGTKLSDSLLLASINVSADLRGIKTGSAYICARTCFD